MKHINDAPALDFIESERASMFRPKRLFVVFIYLALAIAPGTLGALTRPLMVDAYVQVSAFVATTLFLFYLKMKYP